MLTPQSPTIYCPLAALDSYEAIRGNADGPLFLQQSSIPLTRPHLATFLRSCLIFSNLSTRLYNTHSFRIGRATQMAIDGFNDDTIKSTGRWNSTAYL